MFTVGVFGFTLSVGFLFRCIYKEIVANLQTIIHTVMDVKDEHQKTLSMLQNRHSYLEVAARLQDAVENGDVCTIVISGKKYISFDKVKQHTTDLLLIEELDGYFVTE